MAEPIGVEDLVKHSKAWIRLKIQAGWKITVQQVPPHPSSFQHAICAHLDCKHDSDKFQEYTFCVIFESGKQWKTSHLAEEPPVNVQALKMDTTASHAFLYHLKCFEAIFDMNEQVEDGIASKSGIPLAEFAHSILAETRGYGPINFNYSLGYQLHYLLEKWTGLHVYQDFVDQKGEFDENLAIAVYGYKPIIMDAAIYTSILSVIRRNQVECSYHFRNLPAVLAIDQNLKNMRLSEILTLGERWAWEIAYIDECCLKYRKARRMNGQDTDSE